MNGKRLRRIRVKQINKYKSSARLEKARALSLYGAQWHQLRFLLFRSFGIYLAKYAAKMKQMSAKPHDRIPFQRTSNRKPTNRIIMLKSKKVSVK